MKLQQKYFLSYLFFISLFSAVLAFSLSFFFSAQAKKELKISAEKTYSQTATLLNYQFKQYLYTSYIISNSNELINTQNIPAEEIAGSIGIQFREATFLRNMIKRSLMPLTDAEARLYVDDSLREILDHDTLESISLLQDYDWYQDFRKGNILTTWQCTSQSPEYTASEIPSLSLFRKVNTTPSRGWICELYISQESLQDILKNADPTEEGIVFLQSEEGVLLSGTDLALSNQFLQTSAGNFRKGIMNWEEFLVGNKKYQVYSRSLSSTNWYLTLLLPTDINYHQSDTMLTYMLFIFGAILIISLIAARLFTQGFTRRLLQLERKMAALCEGDLDTRIEVKGTDEVSHLFHSFNHMAAETKHLVQQQYENGIRIKAAELNALQAQINPHFLYNTLELINWKAMENDCMEIVEISQELARFYRLTLGSGHSLVPLRNELEHITRYLSIQNFRFAQEIRTEIDAQEDCLDLLIPRLTLQPLVENSVLHGFLPRVDTYDGENIIFLTVRKNEDSLLITLRDNGIGMSEERMNELLMQSNERSSKSFGIKNIQQRLQMLYGQEYGLSYSMTENHGVCVSILLKLQK